MNDLELPQFSNTCGKLFADKLILSSSNEQSEINLNTINNVAFTTRPEGKSLFFIALPILLFALPMLIEGTDFFVKALFSSVGAVLLLISIVNATKKYTLSLQMKDGSSVKVDVWQGNRKEAQKFADRVKAKLSRKQ
jgi:hypothetical protein